MKRMFFLVAAVGLVASNANAADMRMPMKAPPVIAPVMTWTGFYIGANGGYSWGRARTDNTSVAVVGGAPVPLGVTQTLNLNGGVAGGQIGYNWQVANWVWGLEGDGQWSGERGSLAAFAAIPGVVAAGATFSQTLQAFGTFRGRVGILATPEILLYGTGGLAVGSLKSSLAAAVAVPGVAAGVAGTSTTTHAGWTAGAGIEGMFAKNWSAKLEYLYMDLGRFNNAVTLAGVVTFAGSTRVTDNIIRAGVNYHF